MSRTIRCVHCGCDFKPDLRVKNQRYCSAKECQRARKRAWQQEKLRSDPDYKANQRDCQREWHKRHPGYYRHYRERHPKRCERNRLMQRYRNSRKRSRQEVATMDASTQKVLIIPVG